MTVAISRWFGAALINFALLSPAFALDENFGDEAIDPNDHAATGSAATDKNSAEQAASATSPANSDFGQATAEQADQINVYDDPLTFNALRRITLKQLRVDANANQPESIKDPLQPLNRKIYLFNTKLDKYLLLPVASRYKKHVPEPIQIGVSNFFSNLGEPWNAVNHLLQGHPKSSYRSLGRFTLNTFTTLGLADPAAKHFGVNKEAQDFGLTLGKWGLRSGPFLMLPGLGPSTLRDGTGRIADIYGRPQHYMDQNTAYWTTNGLNIVNTRAGFIGVENLVQGDQYALLRDLYLQRRQYLVAGDDPGNAIDNSFGDEGAGFGDDDDFDGADLETADSDAADSRAVGSAGVDTDSADISSSDFGDEPEIRTDTQTESDTAIEQDDVF